MIYGINLQESIQTIPRLSRFMEIIWCKLRMILMKAKNFWDRPQLWGDQDL